jgi:hypothetical protein
MPGIMDKMMNNIEGFFSVQKSTQVIVMKDNKYSNSEMKKYEKL